MGGTGPEELPTTPGAESRGGESPVTGARHAIAVPFESFHDHSRAVGLEQCTVRHDAMTAAWRAWGLANGWIG